MKAIDVVEHFLSRADWVDRENTVDRVIAGDPNRDVDRCLVSWMPSFAALRQVVERGISLLVCHEPTFWNHRDDKPTDDDIGREKMAFIRDNDLTVVRNHDCWDRWPDVGIPSAWGRFLELGDRPDAMGAGRTQHRYDVDPMPLDEFAKHVARLCAGIGEPFVQVTGDGSQLVSRIGVGTGCGCNIPTYIEMGCDCSIVCDDGSCYWSGIQMAHDMGHPVIRVNHGTSEEAGMITLTRYIDDTVDGLAAEHLPHGGTFRLVGVAD